MWFWSFGADRLIDYGTSTITVGTNETHAVLSAGLSALQVRTVPVLEIFGHL